MRTPFGNENELWEYLLIAHPDEAVKEKVMEEKKSFHQAFNHPPAVWAKPHITVANFLAKEPMEETLVRWIKNVCLLNESFTTTLNDFSGFEPHTIYLKIENAEPFKKIAVQLKDINDYVRSSNCPPVKLVTAPHLTIARQLPYNTYVRAMEEYAQRRFHASFSVNELVLLKKRPGSAYKHVNVFGLSSQSNSFN